MTQSATFTIDSSSQEIHCQGQWTIRHINTLSNKIKKISDQGRGEYKLVAGDVSQLDSAGALLLSNLHTRYCRDDVDIQGLKPAFQSLVADVDAGAESRAALQKPKSHNVFYRVGEFAANKLTQFIDFLGFFGEMAVLAVQGTINPRKLAWRDLVGVMQETGFKAMSIIALMMFLIGIVIAYQLAVQLRQYGANIFIVDTTGIAILREFAPLITAVIMAGRTSTAFAALIGTMIVNEEVDALRTMGIQPVLRLVIPRIIGLLITLPLLTVWANIFGIMGSMFMSKSILNIGYETYLTRFDQTVGLTHYILGMIKTPVFAIVIASVGCFQGFSVSKSAESVGQQTTKAAVQTIFIIIIVDAIFSIAYSMLGL